MQNEALTLAPRVGPDRRICYDILMPLSYAQQKALAMQWKAAAPALRKARHADIRRENNAQVIRSLDELSRYVLRTSKSRTSSGFVQMYRILGSPAPR